MNVFIKNILPPLSAAQVMQRSCTMDFNRLQKKGSAAAGGVSLYD